jgi:hypothetical protein
MKEYTFSESNPPVLVDIIVKRHDPNCSFPKTKNRKQCRCPKYFYISPGRLRISANEPSWEKAKVKGEAWVKAHDPSIKRPTYTPKLIREAFADYLSTKTGANLQKSTLKKILTLRNALCGDPEKPERTDHFVAEWNAKHTAKQHLVYIHELQIEHMKAFAKTWDEKMPLRKVHKPECNRKPGCECREIREQMATGSKRNRRGYLREMFDNALKAGWRPYTGETVPDGLDRIPKDNPANFIEVDGAAPKAKEKMPLTDRLWEAFLAAIDTYCAQRDSFNSDPNLAQRAKTFFTLMKTTGFALTDAFIYRKDGIVREDGRYFLTLFRKKTGKRVKIVISDRFHQELMNVPPGLYPTHPNYVFWSGPDQNITDEIELRAQETEAADTMAKLWVKVFQLIDPALLQKELKRDNNGALIMPTTHCLRYNFSETILEAGASVPQLAKLLGDTAEVADLHYNKLSPKAQKSLDSIVEGTWEKEPKKKAAKVLAITRNRQA